MSPELVREGDDFAYAWPKLAVLIRLSAIYEDSRRSTHGEIRIDMTDPATGKVSEHLHWSNIGMSSNSGREDLVRTLTKRDGQILDWDKAIRYACTDAAMRWRQGAPEVILAHVPLEEAPSDLIDGVLPYRQTTTLYGDGEDCKSLTAISMGLALAIGRPVGPFKPVAAQNVLILDWETTDQEQLYRLQRLCAGLFLDVPENIIYLNPSRRLTDEAPRIRQMIDRYTIGFVIVDSLIAACGSEGNDDLIVPTYNTLRNFTTCTRLVLTHMAKAEREKTNNSPYGSVFVTNYSRAVWRIKKTGGNPDEWLTAGLFCEKRNRGSRYHAIGIRYEFDDDHHVTTLRKAELSDDPELAQRMPLSQRISRVLLSRGRLTKEQIAEETGASLGSVSGTLSRMPNVQSFPPRSGAGDGRAFLYAVKAAGD